MITILKQQKKLFMNLIMNSFVGEGSENSSIDKVEKPKQENESLNEKRKKIKDFINDPSNSFSKENYFYIQYLKVHTDEIDTIINQEFQWDEWLMINEFTIETIVNYLKGKENIKIEVENTKNKLKDEIIWNTSVIDGTIKTYKHEINPIYFIRSLFIRKGITYKGQDVKELQNFLKIKYNIKSKDFCNWIYNKETEKYVKEYIKDKKIKLNEKNKKFTSYWGKIFSEIKEEIKVAKVNYYEKKVNEEKEFSKKSIDAKKDEYITRTKKRTEKQDKQKTKLEEEAILKKEKEENKKKEYIEFFNKIVFDEKYKKIDKGWLQEELLKKSSEDLKELDKKFDNLIEEDDKWFVDKEKELIDLVKKELPWYKTGQEISKKEIIEISNIVKKLAKWPAIERKVKANVWKEINYDSLSKIIEKYNTRELENLVSLFEAVETYKKEEWKSIPWNRTYEYIFDKYLQWYDKKWFILDKKEIKQIKEFIESKIAIKDSILWNFEEKKKVLFDFNDDYKLDNEKVFYNYEKEIFDAIETQDEFNNLLINLWYDKETFNKEFINNPDKTKKQFKDRLGILISSNEELDPWLLLSNPNAIKEYLAEKEKVTTEAGVIFDKKVDESNNEVIKEIKQKDKSFYEKIKLEAIGVLVSSERVWAWLSINVQEITKYVDSLQLGIINWVPWIWLSKNLYGWEWSWKRARVDAWFINFIPYLSATVKLKDWKVKVEKLLQEEVKSWLTVKLNWTISLKTGFVWLEFLRVDETQKEWIDKLKEEMREKIKDAFIDIENDKDVKDTKYKNTPEEKESYELLKSLYIASWKWNNAKDMVIKWTINNYERHLYENLKKGIKFQWIWVWIAIIAKIAFPVVIIEANKSKMSWEERKWPKNKPNEKPKKKEYIDSEIEWLEKKLLEIESKFNHETRYEEWSRALMNPNNNLDTRWKWLIKISERKPNLWLSEIISWVEKINWEKQNYEKWYVISTVSQYMKKAHNYNNWDITSWDIKEKIDIDDWRREKFNMNFWFDASYYAKLYNDKLLEADKKDIDKIVQKWVWFDATSSINVERNRTVSWIDVFHANLQVITVKKEPLLIKIDEGDMKIFVETIQKKDNLLPDVKQLLIDWFKDGTLELYYYRDANWFDDRLMLKLSDKVTSTKHLTKLYPAYRFTHLFGAGMWKELNPEKPKYTDESTTPWVRGPAQTWNTLWEAVGWAEQTITNSPDWTWFNPN